MDATGGRVPFSPLYRADMTKLYGVDFILDMVGVIAFV
jgi:hypothetical protein